MYLNHQILIIGRYAINVEKVRVFFTRNKQKHKQNTQT